MSIAHAALGCVGRPPEDVGDNPGHHLGLTGWGKGHPGCRLAGPYFFCRFDMLHQRPWFAASMCRGALACKACVGHWRSKLLLRVRKAQVPLIACFFSEGDAPGIGQLGQLHRPLLDPMAQRTTGEAVMTPEPSYAATFWSVRCRLQLCCSSAEPLGHEGAFLGGCGLQKQAPCRSNRHDVMIH